MALLTGRHLLLRALLLLAGPAAPAAPQPPPAALPAQPSLESDVKAAFLYNFGKFVEWPAAAIDGPDPFRLCVVADAGFVSAVDRLIDGESIQGKRLTRREPASADDARRCHILYIGAGEGERGARLLGAVRQSPVLTVGEGSSFLRQGGAIGFVLDRNRVRFDVSVPAADRAGLKVSSKVLRLARTVDEGRQP
jgi:hypothetical protein